MAPQCIMAQALKRFGMMDFTKKRVPLPPFSYTLIASDKKFLRTIVGQFQFLSNEINVHLYINLNLDY